MSRDAKAEAMRHRIDGATLAFFEREQSLPKQQRRAACRRGSSGNRTVRANRNWWSLTLKKLSSQTVGCRRPHKPFRDVHRVVRSCFVEFGKSRKTRHVTGRNQLVSVKPSNRRDPPTARDTFCARGDDFLHID